MNLLGPSDAPEYLSVGRTVLEDSKQISSNDWVADYAPGLDVGERLVVELPDPSSGMSEDLAEAIEELREAREELQKGEWLNCVHILQNEVLELVDPNKGAEDLWDLQDIGYSHQAESAIEALGSTFQDFAGKFRHRRGRDDERMDDTEPYREDAYFLYTTAAGLIQLLARKQEIKSE